MPRLTSYRIEKSWRTQARVPAGVPTGGEWTHGGGGGFVPLSGVAGLTPEQRFADAGVESVTTTEVPAPIGSVVNGHWTSEAGGTVEKGGFSSAEIELAKARVDATPDAAPEHCWFRKAKEGSYIEIDESAPIEPQIAWHHFNVPSGEWAALKNKNAYTVMELDVSKLNQAQTSVTKAGVKRYIEMIGENGLKRDDLPGGFLLPNGRVTFIDNHRTMAQLMLTGRARIKVYGTEYSYKYRGLIQSKQRPASP